MIDFKLWASKLGQELSVAVRCKGTFLGYRGDLCNKLKGFSDKLEQDGGDYFYYKKYMDSLVDNKALSNIGVFGISMSDDALLKEIMRFFKTVLENDNFEVLYRVYCLSDRGAIIEISKMTYLMILDFIPLLELPRRGVVAEFFDYMFHFSLKREELSDVWFELIGNDASFRALEPWFLLTDHIPYGEDIRVSTDKWMIYPPYYFARRYFENSHEAFYCGNLYETSYIEALVHHMSKFESFSTWFVKSSGLSNYFIDLFRVNNRRLQETIRPFYIKMIIISQGSIKSLLVNDLIEFLFQDWLEKKDSSDFIYLFIKNSEKLKVKSIDSIISIFFSKAFKDLKFFDKNDFDIFTELIESPRFNEIIPQFLCDLQQHDAYVILSHSSLALFDERDILKQISFLQEEIPLEVEVTTKLNESHPIVKFVYSIFLNFFSNTVEENESLVQMFRKLDTLYKGVILITTNTFVKIIKYLLELCVTYENSYVDIMSNVQRICPDPGFVKSIELILPDSKNFIETSMLIENIRLFKEFYIIIYSSMHIKHGSYFEPS
ncbi:hypothetical protein CLIB1444_01S07536 [[Candida] jaroonii]|uniref:Uncharacterized protein n=1 Tax=[Candida] jaroonii TaxID=467808 RepID=A0ACA9Y0L3_9ASCO|nr:hypothetical protein CLIB1444_01S07536 [[Candida] jaroonii]